MLQEGFIKVFQDLAQFDDKRGALWSWMKRVVINACLQYLRKRKDLNFETADFLDVTHPGEEDEAIYPEMDTKILLNYLQRLPDGYRKVFNLHIMEGYSHREIAEYLGISLNTSKSQLSKAKSYLRNWIKEQSLKANISPKLAVVK
jgi:RNA polymerase sigma-70 factor (ECF subfamily)